MAKFVLTGLESDNNKNFPGKASTKYVGGSLTAPTLVDDVKSALVLDADGVVIDALTAVNAKVGISLSIREVSDVELGK